MAGGIHEVMHAGAYELLARRRLAFFAFKAMAAVLGEVKVRNFFQKKERRTGKWSDANW